MAKQQSTSKPAAQKEPKIIANIEAQKIFVEACSSLRRFSKMIEGIDTFCSHVPEGNVDLYNFAVGISTLTEVIQRDAGAIERKLSNILICPEGGAR
jgi:hypothetical protein